MKIKTISVSILCNFAYVCIHDSLKLKNILFNIIVIIIIIMILTKSLSSTSLFIVIYSIDYDIQILKVQRG